MVEIDVDVVRARVCPYCGSSTREVDSIIIYRRRSYGPARVCVQYPACDSYVGCHPGTNRPLGRLANAELREWKGKAHKAFDPLWRTGKMKRSEAYKLLASLTGLDKNLAHIGMLDVEDCRKLVSELEKLEP